MAIHIRQGRKGTTIRATGVSAATLLNRMAPDTEHTVAFCWASGLIETGVAVPKGAIFIARGQPASLQKLIAGTARLASDDKSWLVPGVPEAESEVAKSDALAAYLRWIARRASETLVINSEAGIETAGRV